MSRDRKSFSGRRDNREESRGSQNRNKFEKIILDKGLELLQKVKKEKPDPRKRPLGDTVKSHKTLGTGTLFFTWRNISNTCPIIFW